MENKSILHLQKPDLHSILLIGKYDRHLCTEISNSSIVFPLLQSILNQSKIESSELQLQNVDQCWTGIHRIQKSIRANHPIFEKTIPKSYDRINFSIVLSVMLRLEYLLRRYFTPPRFFQSFLTTRNDYMIRVGEWVRKTGVVRYFLLKKDNE